MSLGPYRVEDRGYATPCWIWGMSCTRSGYAQRYVGGRVRRMHIVFWEAEHGPVPDGLELDHLCSQRPCVNPDHLEPVTHAENIRRGRRGPSILDAEAVTIIRRSRPHVSLAELAARFGVARSTISAAAIGQNWSHV